ncbi:hypothetical protein LCGC14_0903680 [marine sediment metagenome]|uniref:Uncharacterized protein n=1 Tax=marine sediment metagenome TaxID=412755 RepID=A0A0F9S2H8_9ZZZZ
MKIYVTFGQEHTHTVNGITLDKDCVTVIEGNTYKECRNKAFEMFDGVFATVYLEKEVDEEFMRFFPRGFIEVK